MAGVTDLTPPSAGSRQRSLEAARRVAGVDLEDPAAMAAAHAGVEVKDARYVRTIEGSRFYNQPIGTLITSDRDMPASLSVQLSEPSEDEFTILYPDERGESGDERYPGTQYWGRYGAAGVAMRTAGQIMLVQRGPANSRAGLWQLPGGALDEKETPYQGAARELREETGFRDVHWLTPLGEYVFEDPSGWRYTTVIADIPLDQANSFWPAVDGKEISQAKWFSPAQIQQMIDRGELVPELAAVLPGLLEDAQAKHFTSSAASVKAGDFRGLTRVGPRQGSHSGGLFEAADGSKWYIKTAPSQEHAASEVLANELYLMAEVRVPRMTLGQDGKGVPELGDRPQVASEWLNNSEAVFKSQLTETHEDGYQAKLREDFAADVWLANWDVAGMGFSNVVISSVGLPYRVDQGGALAWRALGESKGDLFGEAAHEWQTLRDPGRSPDASVIFAGMNLEELRWSVSRLDYLTEDGIRETVIRHGFNDTMADVLIARKYDIQRRLKAEIEAAKLIKPNRRERGESWREKIEGAATEQAALRAVPIDLQNKGSFKLIELGSEQRQAEFAVSLYSANEYDMINRALREGVDRPIDPDLPEEHQDRIRSARVRSLDHVEGIDIAMSYSAFDRDVVVWRGLAINKLVGAGPADVPGDLTGFTWTDPAYTSTSAGKATADRFARDRDGTQTVMEIIVPAGVHALRLSNWGDEAELLLERGLTFRVVEDRGEDPYGIRLLRVEVVVE